MKAVILAGGLGTRLSEETATKPKPMVEIGGRPILWHLLKIFSSHGINQFVICCGYKGYIIKEYFSNYFLHTSDVTIRMDTNTLAVHQRRAEPWEITLVDTGDLTMTGGRLKRVYDYIKDDTFMFTYGDGLSDVNIRSLISHHYKKGRPATVTAVQPPGRYGILEFADESSVVGFNEKPKGDGSWINGGFFVLEPEVVHRIPDDTSHWEGTPLTSLASDNLLSAYRHMGFWQPMDTLRDLKYLNSLWDQGSPPWKTW